MISPFASDGHVLPVGDAVVRAPEGSVLTVVAALRLARRLAAAGPDVAALVAPLAAVPPGSSALTDAARRGRRPWRPLEPTVPHATWCGVHRRGVDEAVEPAGPDGEAGDRRWLGDPDIASHRADATPVTPVDATAECRPTLTTGPVVLLLGLAGDPAGSGLGARWATGLLALGVEARLAVAQPPEGTGLVPACTPTRASLEALRPDVVVALDPAAAEAAARWAPPGEHSRVDLDPTAVGVDLRSWRIDGPDDDLHALVGPEAPVAEVAALAARLCGLPPRRPHTVMEKARPSVQTTAVEVLRSRRVRRPGDRLTTAAIVGRPRDDDEAAWWASIGDQLDGLGVAVTRAETVGDVGDPGLVLLGAGPGLEDVADARHAAARPVARLRRAGDRAATAGGVPVVVPSAALVGPFAAAPVRPWRPAPQRQRQRDLRAAANRRGDGLGRLVLWHRPGPIDAEVGERAAALVAGLPTGVELVVVADEPTVATRAAAAGARPATSEDRADATRWRAVVWDPPAGHHDATGSLGLGVEALLARVPVLTGPHAPIGPGGLAPAGVAADDGAGLGDAIGLALATPGDVLARRQVQARLLHGEQADAVRGHRVLGWLVRAARR